jgi:hypothetical protein
MGNEYGNGTIREIAILIARDIPSHRAWFSIKFLLLKSLIYLFYILYVIYKLFR